ncbi:MAG: CDP-diacylglycerol--glycerol-3-phosphate 3-phosphatidyltransferase [Paenibacillus sp. RIFOXYA1_FULL_44_5]|nr:MAG: CDP-diacylglycerol--glycerol-3-phosphate 3-phosphatidyltransferase [Paenibacillus sp. RIFOXYA1_FULL_44_5]
MNVPNTITISRFVLIPAFVIIFFMGYIKTAFVIVMLAGATDILDGYLARRNKQITQLGIMLDPLADKLMMLAVIISLLVTSMISWLAAAAFFFRDVSMILGSAIFHFRGKKTVPANIMGKLTTLLYYLAFLFIFFDFRFARSFLWIVIGFSFVTAWVYIILFRTINRSDT